MSFGADQNFLQHHRHLDLAGQVGIVEPVGVAQAFARDEFDIFTAKRMAMARREVAERHLEGAADLCLQMVHGAGKAVGRQPFRERIRFEERAIDFLGLGGEDAVQADGAGHGNSAGCWFVAQGRTREARADRWSQIS